MLRGLTSTDGAAEEQQADGSGASSGIPVEVNLPHVTWRSSTLEFCAKCRCFGHYLILGLVFEVQRVAASSKYRDGSSVNELMLLVKEAETSK